MNLDLIGEFGEPVLIGPGARGGVRIEVRGSRTAVIKREDCPKVAAFFGHDRLEFFETKLAALKQAHYALGDEFEDDAAYFDVAIRNAKATAERVAEEQGE